jgi:hypothetical protein
VAIRYILPILVHCLKKNLATLLEDTTSKYRYFVAIARMLSMLSVVHQGCQMAYFETKIPNLGKFWRVLQWKMMVYLIAILVYFMAIWSILVHFVNFVAIWYL